MPLPLKQFWQRLTQGNSSEQPSSTTPPAQWRMIAAVVVSMGVILTTGVGAVRWLGWLQSAELDAYDHLMRRRPQAPTDERFLVIGIDELDIQTRQEFPIRDDTLTELLTSLLEHEPLAIGLDIARDVPQGSGREQLENVIAESDRIIAACLMSGQDNPGISPAPGTPPERVAFADLPKDPDGTIRRHILVSSPGESLVPLPSLHQCNQVDPNNQLVSLGFSMALVYLQEQGIAPSQAESGDILLGDTRLPRLGSSVVGYRRTGATDYQLLLNYRSAEDAVRVVSLTDVLNQSLDPAWIEGKVVLIGYTSPIANDVFATPFSGAGRDATFMSGVVLHAQGASQLINAAMGDRPLMRYSPKGLEMLFIFAAALVGGSLTYTNRKVWVFILLQAGAFMGLYGLCYIAFTQSVWLPLVPGAIALVGTGMGVALLDRADKGGYTQAIYEQVKEQVQGIVKPQIEIDEDKRKRQVEEITESGYFQDLMARAKTIREERKRALDNPLDGTSSASDKSAADEE
ncbi:MAG: CHASE2 domain-containing protein [Cyanobacteria bacterium J06638_20]